MWLWILIGLCIITKVHGYADGAPNDEETCKNMLPVHTLRNGTDARPQTSVSPFEVTYELGQRNEPITVSLQSNSSLKFIGFMLEARERGMVDGGRPVGKFIPINPEGIKLLRCSNLEDSAVTNSGNAGKNLIKVNWTAEGAELDIFFRATFVNTYSKFWEGVDVNVVLRTPPSTPKYLRAITVMMAFSVLLVVEKEELSNILTTTLTDGPVSRCLIKLFKIICCQLCGALEISTLVLLWVDVPFSVTLVVLVSVAIAINTIQLIIISFWPCHEIKEKLCSVIQIGLITAVVFMGVLEIEQKESWLLKVMIAYVVWIFLFVIWVFILNVYKNTKLEIGQPGCRQQRKKELSACKVIPASLIFNAGTMSFTAAVIYGIS